VAAGRADPADKEATVPAYPVRPAVAASAADKDAAARVQAWAEGLLPPLPAEGAAGLKPHHAVKLSARLALRAPARSGGAVGSDPTAQVWLPAPTPCR